MSDELYYRVEQFAADAEKSRREAFEESIRRRRAEKEAFEAMRRAKTLESMYAEELRQRKEIEEENEKIKMQINALLQDLRSAREQKCSLECQTADQELEKKFFSAVELLQKYRKERDELQVECDNAVRIAEELRSRQNEEVSSTSTSRFFSEFSLSDIEEATLNFEPAFKIGEGDHYERIYRGVLHHTNVAIKMLHQNSLRGPLEFQQKVNILSKLRHPNLVTLIGACSEARTLIYEFASNGSLEAQLRCKDNSAPLSWQTRIRIAKELCSVLMFLHSCSPEGIIHGDLKPANILLDANYACKLSTDFVVFRLISEDEFSDNNTAHCSRTEPKGTLVYMDPEILSTGELTPKSDVYSFGIILLKLLTGKRARGIIKKVQDSLDKGNLKDLLDPAAGDWPLVQAKQLAQLAMSCCEINRKNRLNLASVWRLIEPIKHSCRPSSSGLVSEDSSQIPSSFICPINQEIMKDPVVAADGFTYEAEALKEWLDGGHDTSPMTNLKLAHKNLVPNRALRSAIQEWPQQP